MEKIVNVKDRQIKVVPPEMARDNIGASGVKTTASMLSAITNME